MTSHIFFYRRIGVLDVGVPLLVVVRASEGSAAIELNEELVLVDARPVDVDAVAVVGIT